MKIIIKKNIFFITSLLLASIVCISFYLLSIKNNIDKKEVNVLEVDTILKPHQRIFCLIISTQKTLNNQARAVNQTWANHCDKYFFIIKLYNNSSYSELIDPLPILHPQSVSNNSSMQTEDMFWSYKYISKKYPDYDWYLKTEDRAFFFMQNLRRYLLMKNHSHLINCARDWTDLVKKGYASSISSFILSKDTMKVIGKTLDENYKFCANTGVEYLDTVNCLNKLKIITSKTYDLNRKELFFESNFIEEYQKRVSSS